MSLLIQEVLPSAYAKATNIKGSVRKLALVANLIRGMDVQNAMDQLVFSKKSVAKVVAGVLNSAIANAESNENLDIDNLFVSAILVGRSRYLKRFSARGRGRSAPIRKHYSNITIFVTERY